MSSPEPREPSTPRSATIAAPLAVFAIALVVRLVGLHHTPYVDELNHVMAAHSLLARGTFELTPGGEPYTRARLFTWLVAALFRVFGESLAVARMPAVLAGAALVDAALRVGALASPDAPQRGSPQCSSASSRSRSISRSSRASTRSRRSASSAAAILIYRAVTDRTLGTARALQLCVGALLLFLLALHFQVITFVGIAGVLLWAVADRARASSHAARRWRFAVADRGRDRPRSRSSRSPRRLRQSALALQLRRPVGRGQSPQRPLLPRHLSRSVRDDLDALSAAGDSRDLSQRPRGDLLSRSVRHRVRGALARGVESRAVSVLGDADVLRDRGNGRRRGCAARAPRIRGRDRLARGHSRSRRARARSAPRCSSPSSRCSLRSAMAPRRTRSR